MKMKTKIAAAVAAGIAGIAAATDLAPFGDLAFAEKYAYSTNRAALVATLRPDTKQWYVYSILEAQTSGRLDDADALLLKWRKSQGSNPSEWDAKAHDSLRDRNRLLRFDAGKATIDDVRIALKNCGVDADLPDREEDVAPNTYPAALTEKDTSFEAFNSAWLGKEGCRAKPGFRYIDFLLDPKAEKHAIRIDELNAVLPDTPGLTDWLVRYLKASPRNRFHDAGIFSKLTLEQLSALAEAMRGDDNNDLLTKGEFVKLVYSKLAPGADDDPDDPEVREELLRRRLAFADALTPGRDARARQAEAVRAILELRRSVGDLSDNDLFMRYLALCAADLAANERVSGDDLIDDYVAARRRAGGSPAEFADYLKRGRVRRVVAETDLLDGKDPATVDADALRAGDFERIRDRVELTWAKSNPRVFAADGKVRLAIDVKNAPRVRVAVYELDAFAACREAGGEVGSGIDLDSAVPTASRTLEYGGFTPFTRHRETLEFPELAKPGLYVVECSAGGIASRAVVRKGRLRVVERRDAAGHVFTALDEAGRVVKGARAVVDGESFAADENGEISVPFAADANKAGRKTAVVGAGGLAAALAFDHAEESFALDMSVAIPQEAFVAGREATALIRPSLSVAGVKATLALVEKPTLTATFTDIDGRTSVKTVRDFALFDDAESVYKFTVPKRLASVRFDLAGRIRKAVGEGYATVEDSATVAVNDITKGDEIAQFIMRGAADGYALELRGRTGEPIPNAVVGVEVHHRAMVHPRTFTLQTDAKGEIRLGALKDIEKVAAWRKIGGGHRKGKTEWELGSPSQIDFPREIALAEGEDVEIPARGLFEGGWPHADDFAARVSLLAENGDGLYTADCIGACSYSNGLLRVAGLRAGDYRLTFRAEDETVLIRVAKADGAADGTIGANGVVAGANRSLSGAAPIERMRIAEAILENDGLTVRLDNAAPDARIHVFATRTAADASWVYSPAEALASSIERAGVRAGTLGEARSMYVSGRDLGDKLRYILDRRQEPGRIGNMLRKPSLLLTPWSVTDTETGEINDKAGRGWENQNALAGSAPGRGGSRGSQSAVGDSGVPGVCLDFLPDAALVVANVRPDANGVARIDLSALKGRQAVSIVAFDSRSIDETRLALSVTPFNPRDLRVPAGFDPLAGSDRVKEYATVGEVWRLLRSLDPKDAAFEEFGFVADWADKSDAEKRALYGKYACHELDFFLYMKDRAFFDAAVAPNLRNKRFKRFMDEWLLGADLSRYAGAGEFANLNALEKSLLAMRVDGVAARVADSLAAKAEAAARDLDDEDRRLSIAMDDAGADNAAGGDYGSISVDEDAEVLSEVVAPRAQPRKEGLQSQYAADLERRVAPPPKAAPLPSAWSSQASFGDRPMEMRAMTSSRSSSAVSYRRAEAAKRAEVARRSARQFYRPPERTREWIETHHWRRRLSEGSASLVPANRFWRDFAAAVADGSAGRFLSPNAIYATSTFTEKMAVLSVLSVGFAEADGAALAIGRGGCGDGEAESSVGVVQRIVDPEATDDDGVAAEVPEDGFVKGRVYRLCTIVMNQTPKERRVRVVAALPDGAVPLYGGRDAIDRTLSLDPYSVEAVAEEFYFPLAGQSRLAPAVAVENGLCAGEAKGRAFAVLDAAADEDRTAWSWISRKGDKSAVLKFLREANLEREGIDLADIGWRMKDGAFAKKVVATLESRGVMSAPLWLAGLKWADAFDARRIREAVAADGNAEKVAKRLGPWLETSVAVVAPEEAGIFEHKEYWPMINARTHSRGGSATIPNAAFAKQYRAFLDALAAKRALSDGDRLLAAVYLFAQDRVEEAAAFAEAVSPDGVETKMQRDYLLAYLAFSRGEPGKAREIAAKYADWPVPRWRGLFGDVIAQADEALAEAGGGAGGRGAADETPSLEIAADAPGGAVRGVAITSRNLRTCTVSAYPVDVEIAFSKAPFAKGLVGGAGVRSVKPAWSEEVAIPEGGRTAIAIPEALRGANLVVYASGADGRAEAKAEVVPSSMDVQVLKETRQLRVRDAAGRPVAGAYVKVYVRDATGFGEKYHKDGYTDLRGAFDYASVSTDGDFKPAECAILVLSPTLGAKTLKAPF